MIIINDIKYQNRRTYYNLEKYQNFYLSNNIIRQCIDLKKLRNQADNPISITH